MRGQTLVVGAGPAGLAVSARLRRRGLPCELIDAGDEVGASWRDRYDSLHLHTARWLSGLPGAPLPRRFGPWVRRDDLVAYLRDYAAERGLRPEFGVEATRIDRDGTGWCVRTATGDRHAAAVVIASGYSHTPWVPDLPGRGGFPGSVRHSHEYVEPSRYRGRRVIVVGSGNSAADIVVDLVGVAGQVYMAVRTPPTIMRRATFGLPTQLIGIASGRLPGRVLDPVSRLLRTLTVPDLSEHGLPAPTGGYSQFLRSRTVPILDCGFVATVRSGRVRIVPAVAGFTPTGVRLADGGAVDVDDVVLATGYRPGLEPVVGHLGVLDPAGLPLVSGGRTLPPAPRLHFIGIEVELAGLLRQIRIESGQIARALATQLS